MSKVDETVMFLYRAVIAMVRGEGPTLTAHQLAVLLTCYTVDKQHTVRGLAADLNVSKSVITRALDELGTLDLIRREPDRSDMRSVFAVRTAAGHAWLKGLSNRAMSMGHNGTAHHRPHTEHSDEVADLA